MKEAALLAATINIAWRELKGTFSERAYLLHYVPVNAALAF